MRVKRAQLLVTAAVVVGLFVPAVPAATALPDAGGPSSGKQMLLKQLAEGARPPSARPTLPARGALSRLAAERDSGRVIISVKVRSGANAAAAKAAVASASRAQGGKQRRVLGRLGTVTVEVPQAAAGAFTAQMRALKDVAKVDLVPRRTLSYIPDDEKYADTAPYLDKVNAPAAWDVHKTTRAC